MSALQSSSFPSVSSEIIPNILSFYISTKNRLIAIEKKIVELCQAIIHYNNDIVNAKAETKSLIHEKIIFLSQEKIKLETHAWKMDKFLKDLLKPSI